MRHAFAFPHHAFGNKPDEDAFELVSSEIATPVAHPSSADIVPVPKQLRAAGVAEIKLIHGTFAGDDIIGLMRLLSRLSWRLGWKMRDLGKHLFDQVAGEVGNYTQGYADCLSQMLNSDGQDDIVVSRFHWSGENHHLGRACGVLSLLDQIYQRQWAEDARLLLFAHSHGGNVLAMMTLLLGACREAKEAFLQLMEGQYNRGDDNPEPTDWDRIRSNLMDDDRRAELPHLDIVTFGTPLRYRWDVEVCKKLLHIVHHHPLLDDEPARSVTPSSVDDLLDARGGDYVQHLGIGGTDFPRSILAWKSWRCERELRRIFAPNIRKRDLIKNLSRGERVSVDGKTLLVDYASCDNGWKRKLLGHGVYTCSEWLPFHLRVITDEFYPSHEAIASRSR